MELALLMPFLLVLALCVADLGRAFNAYIIITNASREGARIYSRSPCHGTQPEQMLEDYEKVVAATQAEAAERGLDPALLLVLPDPDPRLQCPASGGSRVAVGVEYNFTPLLGPLLGLVGGGAGAGPFTLRNSTAMVWFGND